MKKPATLCIVDMQPRDFPAADARTRKEVVKLVKEAKRNGAGIVVLEYSNSSPTSATILNTLKGYRRKVICKKNHNDGSKEFIKACERHRFNKSHIRVCGVYTEYCVQETTEGLHERLPGSTIEVVVRACNGDEQHEQWAFEEMKQLEGVKIV